MSAEPAAKSSAERLSASVLVACFSSSVRFLRPGKICDRYRGATRGHSNILHVVERPRAGGHSPHAGAAASAAEQSDRNSRHRKHKPARRENPGSRRAAPSSAPLVARRPRTKNRAGPARSVVRATGQLPLRLDRSRAAPVGSPPWRENPAARSGWFVLRVAPPRRPIAPPQLRSAACETVPPAAPFARHIRQTRTVPGGTVPRPAALGSTPPPPLSLLVSRPRAHMPFYLAFELRFWRTGPTRGTRRSGRRG